jgi:hypothetical protein
VATHRELAAKTSHAQALARIRREAGSDALELVGLERSSVERMLAESLQGALPGEIVSRVHAVTGGNPFFVAELARWFASRGLSARQEPELASLPVHLRDAVRTRLVECSEACQELLRVASVIGPQFSLALLRPVLQRLGRPLEFDTLDEAESRHLLRRSEHDYTFAHTVVRETLYEELAHGERMRLHAEIAAALHALRAADPAPYLAELAHHFGEAAALGDAERAVEYGRRAAERASAMLAHEEAAEHYARALRALEFTEPPDALHRCQLLVARGEALAAAHASPAAVQEAFAAAIRLAQVLNEPRLLARAAAEATAYALVKDALLHLRSGSARPLVERLQPALEEALAGLDPRVDFELTGRALLALAVLHAAVGEPERAQARFESALQLADTRSDSALRARVLIDRMALIPEMDDAATRSALALRAFELAQSARRPDLEVLASVARASYALERADRREAERAGYEIERIARDARQPDAMVLACAYRSVAAQLEGRWADAERELQEAASLYSRLHFTPERGAAALAVSAWWLAVVRGRIDQVLPHWEASLSWQSRLPISQFFLARLQAAQGQLEAVRRERKGLDAQALAEQPRADHWLFCAGLSAEIWAILGDVSEAQSLLALLRPDAARVMNVGWIQVCGGPLARPLGSLAALVRDWDDSDQLFEIARAASRTLRSPVFETWTDLDQGRALQGHPGSAERRRGARMVETASQAARQLGLDGLLQAAPRAR